MLASCPEKPEETCWRTERIRKTRAWPAVGFAFESPNWGILSAWSARWPSAKLWDGLGDISGLTSCFSSLECWRPMVWAPTNKMTCIQCITVYLQYIPCLKDTYCIPLLWRVLWIQRHLYSFQRRIHGQSLTCQEPNSDWCVAAGRCVHLMFGDLKCWGYRASMLIGGKEMERVSGCVWECFRSTSSPSGRATWEILQRWGPIGEAKEIVKQSHQLLGKAIERCISFADWPIIRLLRGHLVWRGQRSPQVQEKCCARWSFGRACVVCSPTMSDLSELVRECISLPTRCHRFFGRLRREQLEFEALQSAWQKMRKQEALGMGTGPPWGKPVSLSSKLCHERAQQA